eukprot:365018-Chlamydomonas_euryale.AAC.15
METKAGLRTPSDREVDACHPTPRSLTPVQVEPLTVGCRTRPGHLGGRGKHAWRARVSRSGTKIQRWYKWCKHTQGGAEITNGRE